MRSTEITTGRRFVVVLEPGEEILATLGRWCVENGIEQAVVPMFYGAFRSMRFIATTDPVADEEVPLPKSIDVAYVEGSGSGTVALKDGVPKVHLHAAVGVKSAGASGYVGHVLAAEVHYMTEVVVDEIVAPMLSVAPSAASFGLDTLRFG